MSIAISSEVPGFVSGGLRCSKSNPIHQTTARYKSSTKIWWSHKKSKFDGKVKSSKFKAHKSWGMRRTYRTLQWFTLLNIFFVWCCCFQAPYIRYIFWYGCLQFNRAGDAVQRSHSALLMAVSMSNGSWTFYEAIKILFHYKSRWTENYAYENSPPGYFLQEGRNLRPFQKWLFEGIRIVNRFIKARWRRYSWDYWCRRCPYSKNRCRTNPWTRVFSHYLLRKTLSSFSMNLRFSSMVPMVILADVG